MDVTLRRVTGQSPLARRRAVYALTTNDLQGGPGLIHFAIFNAVLQL